MQVAPIEHEVQVGGGGGYVADRLAEGIADARVALAHAAADWTQPPLVGGLHPREAALAAGRDAVAHLHDALAVEAPQDAIDETRVALEELGAALARLEQMGAGRLPARPVDKPLDRFAEAIGMLEQVEQRLRGATWGFG